MPGWVHSRRLVQASEKPDQQNDREGNANQPEQKTATHVFISCQNWPAEMHGLLQSSDESKSVHSSRAHPDDPLLMEQLDLRKGCELSGEAPR
jgi:hypothetical protein